MAVTLADLPQPVLDKIIDYLTGCTSMRLAATSSFYRNLLSKDGYWLAKIRRELTRYPTLAVNEAYCDYFKRQSLTDWIYYNWKISFHLVNVDRWDRKANTYSGYCFSSSHLRSDYNYLLECMKTAASQDLEIWGIHLFMRLNYKFKNSEDFDDLVKLAFTNSSPNFLLMLLSNVGNGSKEDNITYKSCYLGYAARSAYGSERSRRCLDILVSHAQLDRFDGIPILHKAVMKSDIELTKKLTCCGLINLEYRDDADCTAMFWAIILNRQDCLDHLLKCGARTTGISADALISSAVLTAVRCKRLNSLRILLAHGVNHLQDPLTMPYSFKHDGISVMNGCKISVVGLAVVFDFLEGLKLLVENGCNVNSQQPSEYPPLHLATAGQRLEHMVYLINKGADVNAKFNSTLENFDYLNVTALHLAVWNCYKDAVELLLQAKSDVNVGQILIFRMRGCNCTHQVSSVLHILLNRTILGVATMGFLDHFLNTSGYFREDLKVFLHDLDETNFCIEKTLKKLKCYQIFKSLLNYGADPNYHYNLYCKPLLVHIVSVAPRTFRKELCQANYDRVIGEFMKLTLNHGIDVNQRDDSTGMTALHIAANFNKTDWMALLIKNGASTEVKDKQGRTPLSLAQGGACIDILKYAKSRMSWKKMDPCLVN